jgi:hypothetical protein
LLSPIHSVFSTLEFERSPIEGANLWTEESFKKVISLLRDEDIQKQIFKSKEARQRLDHYVNERDNFDTYVKYWQPFASLFRESGEGKIRISSLTYQVFDLAASNRPIVVIDLSSREEGILAFNATKYF